MSVLVVTLLSLHVRYVKAHVKHDRETLLQLGELSHRGLFDTNVLDSRNNSSGGFSWCREADKEVRQAGRSRAETPSSR